MPRLAAQAHVSFMWDTLSRQRMIRDLHTFLISGRRKSFKKSRNLAVINFKMSELKSVALFSSSLGCAIVFFCFLCSWCFGFLVSCVCCTVLSFKAQKNKTADPMEVWPPAPGLVHELCNCVFLFCRGLCYRHQKCKISGENQKHCRLQTLFNLLLIHLSSDSILRHPILSQHTLSCVWDM